MATLRIGQMRDCRIKMPAPSPVSAKHVTRRRWPAIITPLLLRRHPIMIRAVASVGFLTLVSRITGFVRDTVFAALLGAGPVADAFVVAFRIPNQFRALFAEGAFQAAFVPSFTALHLGEERGEASRFARSTLSLLLLASLTVSLLLILFAEKAIALLAPGMVNDAQRAPLAITYLRYTGIYLVFMSIMAFYASLAQVHGRYAAAAAAPVLLNVILVLALWLLSPRLGDPGLALAIAVPLSGFVQAGVVALSLRRTGEALLPGIIAWSNSLKTFLRRLGPAVLGSSVVQISAFADTIIVSFLPAGQISYLYYADRLYQLPFGVIGLALSTVVLPTLSHAFATKDDAAAVSAFAKANELALLTSLPVAAMMAIGAQAAVSGLFGYGAFLPSDVTQTAAIVAAYALGIPASILMRCLVPTFQAKGDTTTPVRVAAGVLVVSITLKIVLAERLGAAGIAAATAIAAWISFVILAIAAHRSKLIAIDRRLYAVLWRTLLGSLIVAALMWLVLALPTVQILFAGHSLAKAALLIAIGLFVMLAYSLVLWLSGYRRASLLFDRKSAVTASQQKE